MREGSVYDWMQRRPLLIDVPLAGLFSVIMLMQFFVVGTPGFAWLSLLALPVLTLAWRRTRPALAFTAVSLVLAVRAIAVSNLMVGDLVFLFATYSLAAYERNRRVRLAGLGVVALGSAIAGVRFTRLEGVPLDWSDAVFTFVACFAIAFSAWMLGDLKRTRLQRLADLQDRAERIEREREQELQLAAQQERAAVAREMHDVVAHALSVIVVQADGAAYAAERRPEGALAQSVAALQTIGATARDALGETRRLVGVLRDPMSGAELAPAGGIAQLGELVDRVRGAGVDVRMKVGAVDDVPLALGLAAYRVVQESLTNVIKHAGPNAVAEVEVARVGNDLRISVCDNGVGAGSRDDGHGHGLHGMRERVAVHHGVLTAGPAPQRGWHVRATLPIKGVRAHD